MRKRCRYSSHKKWYWCLMCLASYFVFSRCKLIEAFTCRSLALTLSIIVITLNGVESRVLVGNLSENRFPLSERLGVRSFSASNREASRSSLPIPIPIPIPRHHRVKELLEQDDPMYLLWVNLNSISLSQRAQGYYRSWKACAERELWFRNVFHNCRIFYFSRDRSVQRWYRSVVTPALCWLAIG